MDSDESEQKKKEIYIQKKPSINDVMFVSIILSFLLLSPNLKTGLSEKKKKIKTLFNGLSRSV